MLHSVQQKKIMLSREDTESPSCKQALAEDEQATSKDIWSLPNEVLANIFSYLDVTSKGYAAQVCRYWLEVARQQSVWRGAKVTLELWNDDPNNWLIASPSCKRNIIKIEFSDPKHFHQCASHQLPDWLPNLTDMIFSFHNVYNTSTILLLAQRFTNLVSLKFICHMSNSQFSDASMKVIHNHLKSLKHLHLDDCSITDKGIYHLAGWKCGDDGFPQLETLEISNCCVLTDKSLLYLSTCQRSLQQLKLYIFNSITNVGLAYLSRMPRIVQLWLDGTLRSFAKCGDGFQLLGKMPMLRELHLEGNSICYGNLECSRHLARLAHLEILTLRYSHIRDSNLEHLITSNIQKLSLKGCVKITDNGMRHLANMDSLRELDLHDCNICDVGLAHLANGKCRITVLDIGGNRMISNKCGIYLARLVHLETLIASHTRINDFTLVYLTNSHIHKLVLNGSNISNDGLKLLAKMTRLREAVLYDCHHIGFKGLANLVNGGSLIADLAIGPMLNIRGIKQLARMTSLVKLFLWNCDTISVEGLAHLGQGVAQITCLQVRHSIRMSNEILPHITDYLTTLRHLELNRRHTSCKAMQEDVCCNLVHMQLLRCSKRYSNGSHLLVCIQKL